MSRTDVEGRARTVRPSVPGPAQRALQRRRPDWWLVVAVPPLVLLLIVFMAPLLLILARGFTEPDPGLGNFSTFFGTSSFRNVLRNTLVQALLVTVLTLLAAYPYAFLMSRVRPGWRNVLIALVLLSFSVNLLVRSFSWMVLLNDTGVVNSVLTDLGLIEEPLALIRNRFGVVVGMMNILLPYMILPLYSSMSKVDPNLMRAAANLGARPWVAFLRVFLPLTMPGVNAGILIVFILALGFYVTPVLLGGPENMMLGQLIVEQVSMVNNWGMAAAAATVLLALTTAVLLLWGRLARGFAPGVNR